MIQVFDESQQRSDLSQRRETKYVLAGCDVGQLRRLLLRKARRQIHQGPVSIVRSIYFDDPQLSACRANVNGLGHRRKLRLRWYDNLTPTQQLYLEIKWRENRVTGKQRLRVDSAQPIGNMRYRELLARLTELAPATFVGLLAKYSEPIVIVEYRREHFVTPDGRVRLTIDYDLACYDQLGKSRISTTFPARLREFAVLEAKVAVNDASQLASIWSPLALRASRCSKYVTSCRQFGHINSLD